MTIKSKNPKIETSIEYMLSLGWNKEILKEAKKFLKDWENRPKDYYKNVTKLVMKVDMAEREHYRNCINFWEERLNNENRSI